MLSSANAFNLDQSTMFLTLSGTEISILSYIYFVVCKCFEFGHIQNFVFWQRVNPLPHKDIFWRPWETSLLKTRWVKEKLLVMSNFSFSHSVFYQFE